MTVRIDGRPSRPAPSASRPSSAPALARRSYPGTPSALGEAGGRRSRPAPAGRPSGAGTAARSSRPAGATNRRAPAAGEGTAPPNRRGRSAKPARPRRPALTAWLARFRLLTGIIVVISASVLVAWGLRRYLRSSPRFAIKTVLVDGHHRRTPQQITKRAGIEVGGNIFALDVARAASLVEADEWIEAAEVQRDLPNTVRVEITEREARAMAAVDGELLLIDAKGEPFKQVRAGDPSDLPIVTGLDAEDIARDREGVTKRLRRVLDLLADLERVGIARRHPLQEVHLEPDDRVVVTVGSDGIALAMGRPPYRSKVEKADRILVEVARRKAKPGVIFLDDEGHPERVVVRMR